MLNANYEKAYISSFAKIFRILQNEYEVFINKGEYENYEIEIISINKEPINDYLSICFQKQNGSLTIVMDKNIDEELIDKVVKDISFALNCNPLASYNFKDLKDYIIYHFSYVKEDVIIDNEKIIKDLEKNNSIENVNYNIIVNPYTI